MKNKMDTKKLLVSFCAVVATLFLVATVSAAGASIDKVKIDGINPDNDRVVLDAGDRVNVEVYYSIIDDCDGDVELTLEFEDGNEVTVNLGNVLAGETGRKTVSMEVPYVDDLDDHRLVDGVELDVELKGDDIDAEKTVKVTVKRPDDTASIKSVSVSNRVDAGETVPVEIVVKNIGFDDLDDLYVTVSIDELGIERSAYFGDIVALEGCNDDCDGDLDECGYRVCDEDDEDTVSGKLYIEVPYDAEAGVYSLNVEVSNDDFSENEVKQITVMNDFAGSVVVSSTSKTVAAGEEAEYDLLIVNPTDKLKVYRIVTESSATLSSNTNEAVVAVPAGSSKTVKVTAVADEEGEYTFDVNIFSGEALEDTVTLSAKVEGNSVTTGASNPVVVLTVILAIIFIVLLIVLIVLIGKKPEKSEEFGESYY